MAKNISKPNTTTISSSLALVAALALGGCSKSAPPPEAPPTTPPPAPVVSHIVTPDLKKLLYATVDTLARNFGNPIPPGAEKFMVTSERFKLPGDRILLVEFANSQAVNFSLALDPPVLDPAEALLQVGINAGSIKPTRRPGYAEWLGRIDNLPTRRITVGQAAPGTGGYTKIRVEFDAPSLAPKRE